MFAFSPNISLLMAVVRVIGLASTLVLVVVTGPASGSLLLITDNGTAATGVTAVTVGCAAGITLVAVSGTDVAAWVTVVVVAGTTVVAPHTTTLLVNKRYTAYAARATNNTIITMETQNKKLDSELLGTLFLDKLSVYTAITIRNVINATAIIKTNMASKSSLKTSSAAIHPFKPRN